MCGREDEIGERRLTVVVLLMSELLLKELDIFAAKVVFLVVQGVFGMLYRYKTSP